MELVPNSNVQSIEAHMQCQDALNFNTGDLSGLYAESTSLVSEFSDAALTIYCFTSTSQGR